jgi:membrane carboxypeptidase/penicillin-binding protein PbpC
MKKTNLIAMLLAGAMLATISCKQEAPMPTEAEIAQKVEDKYGAELTTLKELKKMQCDETKNQEVSKRLTETLPAK